MIRYAEKAVTPALVEPAQLLGRFQPVGSVRVGMEVSAKPMAWLIEWQRFHPEDPTAPSPPSRTPDIARAWRAGRNRRWPSDQTWIGTNRALVAPQDAEE